MIAIDTSVLIDLIGADAPAASAEQALRSALTQGPGGAGFFRDYFKGLKVIVPKHA